VARYDKYNPFVGNFRAPLLADWTTANLNKIVGVSLNSSGQVVVGGAAANIIGVVILTKVRKAGAIVDVMKHGEIVEADVFGVANTASGLTAGQKVYADNVTGAATLTATSNALVGHTVEAARVVVNVSI
jgi:hypothetical protein